MFKIAMLVLTLLLVSMNALEEEAHEYLAFFASGIFILHAAAQKWWFSSGCPRFSSGLRIKSLSVITLMIVFALTMISGALVSRYAVPTLRVKATQTLMIDLHHALGSLFLLLSFFHFGLHLSVKRIRETGKIKAVFLIFGLLILYATLQRLPDYIYSDFGWNLADLILTYTPSFFFATLIPFVSAFSGFFLNTNLLRRTRHA